MIFHMKFHFRINRKQQIILYVNNIIRAIYDIKKLNLF